MNSMRIGLVLIGMLVSLDANVERVGKPQPEPQRTEIKVPALGMETNRPCDKPIKRQYTVRHQGIGFEILDSESEACFVPDQEYRLLDDLLDTVLNRITYNRNLTDIGAQRQQAAKISATISDVLTEYQFHLFVDTETLSDALVDRGESKVPKHIFDCDTGSLIFLTIAENLGAPVVMVEIPSSGSFDHLYVRWLEKGASLFEWDMNDRNERSTPSNLPWLFGKSMTRQETIGYALSLRAKLWERQKRYDRAILDYQAAAKLYDELTTSNNLAWLVATKEVPRRQQLQKEALAAAQKVVSIFPKPNYQDTLACVYALSGDFAQALELEDKALAREPRNSFEIRKQLFEARKDCTGQQ